MNINRKHRIEDIQKEFSKLFPGLKLAFYKHMHEDHQGSPKSDQYDPDLSISSIQKVAKDGEINIKPSLTIAELENAFEEKLGLHVQVFRRSNRIWLQTSVTDDWTLEKQNSKGLHSIQQS